MTRAAVVPAVVGVLMGVGLLAGGVGLRQLTRSAHHEQESRAAALEVAAAVSLEHAIAHDFLDDVSARPVALRTLSLTRRRVARHLARLVGLEGDEPADRDDVVAVQRDVARVESAVRGLQQRVSAGAPRSELGEYDEQVVDTTFARADRALRSKVAVDARQADRAYAVNVKVTTAIVLAMLAWVLAGAFIQGRLRIAIERQAARYRNDQARAAQEHAERMSEAKSTFLSRMSHELRTPLNAVLGFGQLLQSADLPPRDRENAAQIVHAGRHLLELIDDLLDISRIEAGRDDVVLTAVSVEEAIRETLDLTAPIGDAATVNVQSEVAQPGLTVRADGRSLRQVLLNVLSNAIKYNHPGGSVTIVARRAGDRVRIAVSDTGIGIASEDLPRIFDPFDRLGADQTAIQGTGLGLAVCKRLMASMDGVIDVASEAGAGTTVTLTLPATEAAPLAPADATIAPEPVSVHEPAPESAVATVLYIDDDAASVDIVELILERRPGIRLLSASSGEIGLRLAARHRPDLILLDRNLPDASGDELLRRLRDGAGTARTPIVMLSADAAPASVELLLSAGATDYLTKPIDVVSLLARVDAILRAPTA
jgi:signal transduction histidine kinase/ActR/RegA family two-component response regulator